MQENDELLDGEATCAILKIAKATLYDWVSAGKINCVKAGSLNRFWKSEVYRVLTTRSGGKNNGR